MQLDKLADRVAPVLPVGFREKQVEVTQVFEVETPVAIESSADEDTPNTGDLSAVPTGESTPSSNLTVSPLPERAGPRVQTSGNVPNVQIAVEPITTVGALTNMYLLIPDRKRIHSSYGFAVLNVPALANEE